MTTAATTTTVAEDNDHKSGFDTPEDFRIFTSESNPNYFKLHSRSKSILEQNYSVITDKQLMSLITNQQEPNQPQQLLIIDVRDSSLEDGDFQGGHIYGAVNIPNYDFVDEIPNIFYKKYASADMKNIVFHCMYSRSRAKQCYLLYEKARALLIKTKKKKKSASDVDGDGKDDDGKVNDNAFENIVLGEVAEHLSDAQMANLAKQQVYVLEGGFQKWLNYHKDDGKLTVGFDEEMWDLTRMSGAEDAGMMLYHKHDG